METRYIAIGIALALLIGAGTGYTLSPKTITNPELENQLETQQTTIKTLENNNQELQTVLASTETQNTELQETIKNARVVFEAIEKELQMFESGFGAPEFDSGWQNIDPGESVSIAHGLNTKDDLFVYMIGRNNEETTNQLYYGLSYLLELEAGTGWTLDDTNVHVHRGGIDVHWEEVRVYIWRISQGSSGSTVTDSSQIPDVKYVEIVLNGKEEVEDYSRIIDLYGYKDVTLSWNNKMYDGYIRFEWVIKQPDNTFTPAGSYF